jgi:ribose-phosphate pyrophosphokinase
MSDRDLKVIACPGSRAFSQRMVKHLKRRNPRTRLVESEFVTFRNGEVKCVLKEPVRGSELFIVQDVSNSKTGSVNDNLMALFSAVDAGNHASANEINVIVPTFPYSRQHKKTMREGLTAALMCHFLEMLQVKRVITLDIHSREIQNSFSHTIMENLHASHPIVKKMLDDKIDLSRMTVVSPDTGAISRNTFFANALHLPLAMMYKERDYSKVSKEAKDSNITNLKLIGEIDHGDVLICDDMIDTGGTILKAAKFLKEKGAEKVYVICSLPFFNDPAIRDFQQSFEDGYLTGVFGTNAVYHPTLWKMGWFHQVDVTELFADVVFRINERISLSDLLDSSDEIGDLFSVNVDDEDKE